MTTPQSGPAAAPDPRRPPAAPPSAHASAAAPPAAPPEDDDTAFDHPGGDDTRHDGFGPAKRRIFLKTLAKTGCVADGCRAAGISDTTAYNHRAADPDLAALWRIALSRAAADIELLAWERGVTGIEEAVYAYGKFSHVRIRRNDTIFLRLLEASNPKKYGRRAAPPGRKRILKEERKQMEREIRARIAAEQPSDEEVLRQLAKRVSALRVRHGLEPLDGAEEQDAPNGRDTPEAPLERGAPEPAADAAPDDHGPETAGSSSEAPPVQAGEPEPDDTAANRRNEASPQPPSPDDPPAAAPYDPQSPTRDRSPPRTQDAHASGRFVDSAPKSPTSPPGARAADDDDPG